MIRNDSVIEVWIDENNPGEPMFCVGGMISLHIQQGTIGPKAVHIGTYNTSSMQEAQRLFLEEIKDAGNKMVLDELLGNEGWD